VRLVSLRDSRRDQVVEARIVSAGSVRDPATGNRYSGCMRTRTEANTRSPTTRLFNVKQAAAYLGVSVWTVRDLIHTGGLPVVKPESPRVTVGRRRSGTAIRVRRSRSECSTLRKLLVDIRDLDAFIERAKECAA
jgi:excisionase family DNA binding protein